MFASNRPGHASLLGEVSLAQIASLAYLTEQDMASIVEATSTASAAGITQGACCEGLYRREPRGPQPGLSAFLGPSEHRSRVACVEIADGRVCGVAAIASLLLRGTAWPAHISPLSGRRSAARSGRLAASSPTGRSARRDGRRESARDRSPAGRRGGRRPRVSRPTATKIHASARGSRSARDRSGRLTARHDLGDERVHVAQVATQVAPDLRVVPGLGQRLQPELRDRRALLLELEERAPPSPASRRRGSGSFATASSHASRTRCQAVSMQAR